MYARVQVDDFCLCLMQQSTPQKSGSLNTKEPNIYLCISFNNYSLPTSSLPLSVKNKCRGLSRILMPQSTHCDCVGFWIIRCEADSSPQGERQRGIRILAVRKCQTQTSVRPGVARPSSILIKSLQGKNGFNPKIFVLRQRRENPFDDQRSRTWLQSGRICHACWAFVTACRG